MPRLTKLEKEAVRQAAIEMLAGELDPSSGWTDEMAEALERAADKLAPSGGRDD